MVLFNAKLIIWCVGFYTDGMQLVKQNNQHANLVRELFSRLHRSGFLFIITVSKDQLALLDNWLCWTNKIKMTKFLIFAMDKTSREYAEKLNLFTYHPQENPHDYPIMSTNFEQMTIDEKRFIRGKFLYILLRAGTLCHATIYLLHGSHTLGLI